MLKLSRRPKKHPSFFNLLGRPIFQALLFLFTQLCFLLIFFSRALQSIKVSSFKFPPLSFPSVSLPTISLPKFSLPRLYRLPFRQSKPKETNKKIHRLHDTGLKNFILQLSNSSPISFFNRHLRVVTFLTTVIVLSTIIYFEFLITLPDPRSLDSYPNQLTTQILDRNGVLLYKIYKDENRTLVRLDELPQYVKNAFLAAEDKDFYHHGGFSIFGLLRAVYKNLSDDHLEGGSTITQQLIKNTLLTNEKTITRKIKELILAIEVERIYSKDQIFEMYLNQVGFGGPAYGIQEASKQYFDIDAKNLSLPQAAFLAGLPQAPSKYSPYGANRELSRTRQQLVLFQMKKDGFITEKELADNVAVPLIFKSAKIEIIAPHFVMFIKDLLTSQLGEAVVQRGGLIVTTTLDSKLQSQAQKIVTEEISKLKPYRVTNGAALVTNPQTGDILAMVGSKDYFSIEEDGQVNLTTSLRQPGSVIKPLNYALDFENGDTPSTIIEDKPITINLVGQSPWSPKNYDGHFHGTVSLRQALASSYNIPSVLLLARNGVTNFAKLAQKMGISTWDNPSRFGLSMALGSLEVKMVDLAAAYSAFANQGKVVPLKSILKIEKQASVNLFVSSCPSQKPSVGENAVVNAADIPCLPKQVISPLTAFYISDILADNNARSSAFGFNSVLNITQAKVSVKTGTSNELKDNWAIGYTPDYMVASWVGNNDSAPMANIASGITGASPIWSKIMSQILSQNSQPKDLIPPANLIKVGICIFTGTLPCNGCPVRYEYFEKGKEPKSACNPDDIQKFLNPSITPSVIPNKPLIL